MMGLAGEASSETRCAGSLRWLFRMAAAGDSSPIVSRYRRVLVEMRLSLRDCRVVRRTASPSPDRFRGATKTAAVSLTGSFTECAPEVGRTSARRTHYRCGSTDHRAGRGVEIRSIPAEQRMEVELDIRSTV